MLDRGNEERPIKMRHQACISPDTKSQVYFSVLITFGYLITFQIILCFFVFVLLSTIGYFVATFSKHQSIKSEVNHLTKSTPSLAGRGHPVWWKTHVAFRHRWGGGQGARPYFRPPESILIWSCCEITLIQSGNQKFGLIQLSCESSLIQSECRLDDAKKATFGCINAMNLGSFQTDDLGIEMNTRSCSNKNGSMTSTHPVSFPQFCIAKDVNAFYDDFAKKSCDGCDDSLTKK